MTPDGFEPGNMLLLAIVGWFLLPVVSWIFYDLAILRLRSYFPMEWTKIGSPSGMFYVPAGNGWLRGIVARNRLMKSLLFFTPDWARRDKPSLLFLRLYRAFNAIWLVGVIGVLVIALVRS